MNNASASSRIVVAQQQGSPFPFVLPDQSVRAEHFSPDALSKLMPVGTILEFGGPTPPTGYLLCDGSLLSRVNYANLFAAIGVTHGAGDGTTTFQIPDLRGRASIGDGQGPGLSARSLGQALGEENHVLSASELASHSHSGGTNGIDRSLNHYHYYDHTSFALDNPNNFPGGAHRFGDPTTYTTSYVAYAGSAGGDLQHTHGFSTDGGAVGNSGHNNMQPSLVVKKIIKF